VIAGHCEHCNGPVYGPQADRQPAAHQCCAIWIGDLGYDRCYACTPPSGRIPPAPSRPLIGAAP
jgi:hypothetical protein